MTTDLKLLIDINLKHNSGILILPERTSLKLDALNFIYYAKEDAEDCLEELSAIAIANKLSGKIDDSKDYASVPIFDISLILNQKYINYPNRIKY